MIEFFDVNTVLYFLIWRSELRLMQGEESRTEEEAIEGIETSQS